MSNTNKQMKHHVYLTNGCCEDAGHVGRRVLTSLGLGYGWWTGRDILTANGFEDKPKPEYDFYPLTAEESSFVNEHGFHTGEGYVGLTGYATLYKGQKWLSPIIEIVWQTEDKAKHDYTVDQMHAATQDQALTIARYLAARATERLQRIGGYAEIEEIENGEMENDHWTVSLHIPMKWAIDNLKMYGDFEFNTYCGFLTGLMA